MALRRGKGTAWLRQAGAFVAFALARGTALFFGIYGLASAAASLRGAGASQNIWWVDASFFDPPAIGAGIVIACAAALLAYGVMPRMRTWRRVLTALACGALALIALRDAAQFYREWGAGTFAPLVPVPLSLLLAAVFGLLAWAVLAMKPARKIAVWEHVSAAVALVLVAALFPLAQIGFFGTSDYRAKADAAVVFGARVFDDGTPSPSLRDRVLTGVDLYRSGLVHLLVMSGGPEPNGHDETDVMRATAEKAGVPGSAIVNDPKGLDTDATVRDTMAIFERRGVKSALVVSQGYHLPRVKLAYLAVGENVRTVPAKELEPIWKTPLFIAREVPAFWVYWGRALVRDLRGA